MAERRIEYVGFSQPVFGTLTFGRQNTLMIDDISAYDPMGGAYAFSPIGFSGKAGGGGGTEDARWTTAIKYRVNIGDVRFGVMGQPVSSGYDTYNPNNGAVAGEIGWDIKHFGPGMLSLDASPLGRRTRLISGRPSRGEHRRRRPTRYPTAFGPGLSQGDDLQQHWHHGVGQIQLRFVGKHPAAGRG